MSAISNPSNLLVNISALRGRLSLYDSESALSKSIRNLSTGIRINSGRDDPVGFVASTAMQTDVTSMAQAVKNCERADAVVSTTDSALSHMNSLLNDLRGIVVQAANTGAESTATLKALQLECDAILNTIDFISNSTTFQSQKLIDGSLDFTTYGVDSDKISYLEINQANFLGKTEKDISIQVLEPARQAELHYPLGVLKNDVVFNVGGTGGYETFSFAKDASINDIAEAVNRVSDATGVGARISSQATAGSLALTSYGKNNDIILTASEPGVEASNFVVRYTAPKEGNDTLGLNVTQGVGNEPTVIEVVLQTELWKKAEYHYNGDNDGVSNNEFTIAAKYAGKEFNDVEFEINNVFGTGEETGLEVEMQESPKKFRINVSYDEANPNSAGNTTVAQLADWLAASPASAYFELTHSSPSDGSGPLIPTSSFGQTQSGVDGGAVVSTAEQVATLLNTSEQLKNADGTGRLSAVIPTTSTGTGVVSPFSEYSYYGDPQESNYLQFLGPKNSPNIKFVSTPGSSLSVDDTTYPPKYGHASADVQGLDPGTSFTLRSLSIGPDNDEVGVILRDAADESAVFDPERNAVVVSVDFSGRADGTNPNGSFTMNDLVAMVGDDPLLSSRFTVVPYSSYDADNPPAFDNSGYIGMDAKVGETSGGLVSEGTILVHLETDVHGVVKTTANDLVKFFNDPSDEQSKAVLDRSGISVSNVDPDNINLTACTTGQSLNGTGILKPTYDPADCLDTTGMYPDVTFTSYGTGIREDFPTATVVSQNGVDASFTVTARQAGAAYNNTTVRVVSDPTGPKVSFNPITRQISVGIAQDGTVTANDVLAMINGDPELSELFVASKAPYSTGEGTVVLGDLATLTGGIHAVDNRPTGSVTSANGINATFEVTAKKTDGSLDGTEIRIVADTNGPSVSYDSQSKQLTVGVDPSNPLTARQVVDLINAAPDVRDLFQAAIPTLAENTSSIVPNGGEAVAVGDSGTLQVRSTGSALGAALIGADDKESLGLTFYSLEYGSNEFVSVTTQVGTEFPMVDRFGNATETNKGTDVVAKIDGQRAIGSGRVALSATSDLDLSIWIDPSVQRGDVFGFRISGGGALMQLGPDAVSNHQARIAIKGTSSALLGGVSGNLSQLRTGGDCDLLTDTGAAFKIVEEVTAEIANLRGRLGAFQKTQIQANKENLLDAIEIETGAMSVIKDTDFAAESSEMLRQQVLMQSSISVLQMTGQTQQMLLSLLQR